MKIGIASDHGGFELKEYLKKTLADPSFEIIDYGNMKFDPDDDFPDFVIPLADAVAGGEVDRGIAVCGSGVGACIAANKIRDVRACLVTDPFSAHQGVEDDNMNVLCIGGRIMGHGLAAEICRIFLAAKFIGAERHIRRLAKIERQSQGDKLLS